MLEGLKKPTTVEELNNTVNIIINTFNCIKVTEGSIMRQLTLEREQKEKLIAEVIAFAQQLDDIYMIAFTRKLLDIPSIKEKIQMHPDHFVLIEKIKPLLEDIATFAKFQEFVAENP